MPGGVFVEIDSPVLKLTWKSEVSKMTTPALERKNSVGRVTLPESKARPSRRGEARMLLVLGQSHGSAGRRRVRKETLLDVWLGGNVPGPLDGENQSSLQTRYKHTNSAQTCPVFEKPSSIPAHVGFFVPALRRHQTRDCIPAPRPPSVTENLITQ